MHSAKAVSYELRVNAFYCTRFLVSGVIRIMTHIRHQHEPPNYAASRRTLLAVREEGPVHVSGMRLLLVQPLMLPQAQRSSGMLWRLARITSVLRLW